MILRVADDLVFAVEGFPVELADAIGAYFAHVVQPTGAAAANALPVRVGARGTPPPAPLGPVLLAEPPLEIRAYDRGLLFSLPGLCCRVDDDRDAASVFIDDHLAPAPVAHLSAWLLVAVLFCLGRRRGWLGVHAAAVAIGDRAVLLPGASGCGKSTLHRQAREHGLGVLSDDLVWIRHRGPGPVRVVAFPRGGDPAPSVDDLPLGAVVFPSIVARGPSRLEAVASAEAVRSLLASTAFLAAAARARAHFRDVVAISRSVPCRRLAAGPDGDAVAVLRDHLGRLFATGAVDPG